MTDRERNEDTGKYTTEFTDEDFLDAIESVGPATTQEIRKVVGCAYRTAHERLSALVEDGEVDKQKIGQSLLWSIPDKSEDKE